MKKLLAALLVLFATSASAQNYLRDNGTFQSVVTGTTNGQLLTNAAGSLGGITIGPALPGCTNLGGFPVGLGGGTAQCSDTAGSTAVLNGGPLTITPANPSNTQGLGITQTTPNTGTPTGPILLNSITVTDQGQNVGGTGIDSFGQIANQTNALRINYRVTGGVANHLPLSVAANATGTNGGIAAITGGVYTNVGPITGDQWGLEGYVNVGPSGNLNQNGIALEGQVLVATGGAILNRVAVSAVSQGPVAATGIDAAYTISTLPAGITGYLTAAPFNTGLYFSKDLYSQNQFPIATTGNAILADTGTVANFISAHTLTVTGNILDFPNVSITGAGIGTFSGGQLQITNPSGGAALINTSANGTGGVDGYTAGDSSGNNKSFNGVTEAAFTGTIFGVTNPGSWAFSYGIGSTNAGMMVGTRSNSPVIFGTNNLNRAELFASGCLSIGNTTDCAAPGIVNLLTGIRIGNAATTGHVLRGNGTNFVDAALASTDLSDTTAATTWTPTDGSGASLSFTNGGSNFSKINKTCIGNFHITYPSTANGSANAIVLPCTNANNGAQAVGSCQSNGAGVLGFFSFAMGANSANGNLIETTGLTQPTNATLSGLVFECFFAFITG